MPVVPINYWAVLVCGVVSMVWGYLYYGPIFGKMYSREMGFDTMDPVKRAELMKGMGKNYAITFVAALVMAWVLGYSVIFAESYMHSSALQAGLMTGFMSWLGFIAPVTLSNVLWGTQSMKLWYLSSAYYIVQLLVFGVILANWKM